MTDLVWSDPMTKSDLSPEALDLSMIAPSLEDKSDFGISPRGAGYVFGKNVTRRFLQTNNLLHICRAHQLCMDGYQVIPLISSISVNSAGYLWRYANDGLVSPELLLQSRESSLCPRSASRPGPLLQCVWALSWVRAGYPRNHKARWSTECVWRRGRGRVFKSSECRWKERPENHAVFYLDQYSLPYKFWSNKTSIWP
jgi:hypothetical protein